MVAGLSGVPQVDGFAVDAAGLFPAAVGGDDGAVQDQVGEALIDGAPQDLVQVGCLIGQDVDDLVDVAVGGGAGDAVVAAEGGPVGAVAKPVQSHHRLRKAGQRPRTRAGAQSPAFGRQQLGEMVNQFLGNVERGTIGDHVGLSG